MIDPQEAVEFLRLVSDAESDNRAEGLDDLKFSYGEQWPVIIQNSRELEARPCLTVNETDAFIRQVTNQQRQQRPRGRAHPVNDTSDVKVAEIITGIGRHIENNSNADNAYDLGFEFAARIGWGYWRMRTDYVRDNSFDQDIYIDQIENPFSVYFDPNSSLPDGSDAEKCLITDTVPRETFKKMYPGADLAPFNDRAVGDMDVEWITAHDIRLAEYFKIEKQKSDLVMLSDKSTMWSDQLPDPAILEQVGLSVIHSRSSYRKTVKWVKQTGNEILEEKTLPGRFIPVIPCYGMSVILEGKRKRMGLVRFAKDPQRMVNFWQTSITESIALAPKAKWLMAEGQDEGHENEWAAANIKALPVLRYKQTDIDGAQAPVPTRVAPEPPPAGAIEASFMASENLKRVLGVYDPQTKTDGNKSGKAIQAEKMQSEQSNYHLYDNMTRSIKHTWRIILDWTPVVYDTERVMRIIGDDGKPDLVTLNEKKDADGVQKVLNDVTVGLYDVVMDTGPGFNTKRQEGLEIFSGLMNGPLGEEIAKTGADLIVRMVDADGAQTLADRLAAANPLAQIDDKSDVPPQAQMKIQQLSKQLQDAGKAIEAMDADLKNKKSVEQMRQDGQTKRMGIQEVAETHRREVEQKQKQHDTETYALTAQNVAEINALARLLTSKSEHGNRMREMLQEFEHSVALQDQQLTAKSEQSEQV